MEFADALGKLVRTRLSEIQGKDDTLRVPQYGVKWNPWEVAANFTGSTHLQGLQRLKPILDSAVDQLP